MSATHGWSHERLLIWYKLHFRWNLKGIIGSKPTFLPAPVGKTGLLLESVLTSFWISKRIPPPGTLSWRRQKTVITFDEACRPFARDLRNRFTPGSLASCPFDFLGVFVTTSFMFLLAAVLPGPIDSTPPTPFEEALTEESAWVARGQSPSDYGSPYFTDPSGVSHIGYSTPAIPIQQPGVVQPYQGGSPYMNPGVPAYPNAIQDPFSQGGMDPYANPMQGYQMRGINGPQPVRYGWSQRFDVSYMPGETAYPPAAGNFEIFGIDWQMIHTKPIGTNWTWAIGPQFSYRSWKGPIDPPMSDTDLPGSAYRFGLDMMLRSPTVNGWTFELGFDPSIASDFRSSIDSNSFLYDAHGVAFVQLNPKWTLALGVLYWDRVDDIILPYAGAIWTPNDIWELRIIFPKPRISVFLGTPMGIPTWAYVGAEYHVEAYQIKPKNFPDDTRVQLADWRVAGGLKWETGWLTSFAEAGYIFDRKVEYARYGDNFSVKDGFMARMGFRY